MADSDRQPPRMEDLYLGDLSPRSPRKAFWLSLLSPGWGWLYMGQLGTAIATNLVLVSFWGFFLVAMTILKFFPTTPFLVFGFGWLVIVFMNAADAASAARLRAERFVTQDTNSVGVYLAVFVFSFALPLLGIAHLGSRALWESVSVTDTSMYPTLLQDDHLVVDRSAYRRTPPTLGDIVVYLAPDDPHALFIGRIAGVPGDEVVIEHDIFTNEMMVVSAGPYTFIRAPMREEYRIALSGRVGPIDPALTFFFEDNGRQIYPITLATTPSWTQPTTMLLGDDEYAIINDDRGDLHDSRTFGAVPMGAIRGMPLYVGLSGPGSRLSLLRSLLTGSLEPYRRERFGRRIQLPLYMRPHPTSTE